MLPALSHHFGLRPQDLDRMWPAEVDVYVRALQEIRRQQARGERRR